MHALAQGIKGKQALCLNLQTHLIAGLQARGLTELGIEQAWQTFNLAVVNR